MKRRVFCDECNMYTVPYVKRERITGKIKNRKYKYNGKVARCSRCENEVLVPAVTDYNLKLLCNIKRYKDDKRLLKLAK